MTFALCKFLNKLVVIFTQEHRHIIYIGSCGAGYHQSVYFFKGVVGIVI